MAKLERIYNIPLRKDWVQTPHYKRAKRAIHTIQTFLMKHMKVAELKSLKLGKNLNEAVWARGIKYPPHHVKVTVVKNDEGIVRAELVGFPIVDPTEKKKKGKLETLKDKITGKEKTENKAEAVQQTESSAASEKPKRAVKKKAVAEKTQEPVSEPK